MITVILVAVVIIAIIVSYIVGRVSAIPDYFIPFEQCRYPYEDCRCPKCCNYNYISKTSAKIAEEQAYQKGRYDGKLETMDDIRYTRFMSMSEQEKFVSRFNECLKPLEEMKKDIESGKF